MISSLSLVLRVISAFAGEHAAIGRDRESQRTRRSDHRVGAASLQAFPPSGPEGDGHLL